MRVLVLSGGGAKIAFLAGVAERLICDFGLSYDIIAGVSSGNLCAAMLAQGPTQGLPTRARHLRKLCVGIDTPAKIYTKGRAIDLAWRLLTKGALYDPAPLVKIIKSEISHAQLWSAPIIFRGGVVELESGRYHTVGNDPGAELQVRHELILASSSVPGTFPPVVVGGVPFVDGGVRNITPLRDAIKVARARVPASAIEVDVVLASPLWPEYTTINPTDIVQVGTRTLSLLVNEVYQDDLVEVLERNRDSDERFGTFRVWAPTSTFGMGTMEFDPLKAEQLLAHAREIAPLGPEDLARALHREDLIPEAVAA